MLFSRSSALIHISYRSALPGRPGFHLPFYKTETVDWKTLNEINNSVPKFIDIKCFLKQIYVYIEIIIPFACCEHFSVQSVGKLFGRKKSVLCVICVICKNLFLYYNKKRSFNFEIFWKTLKQKFLLTIYLNIPVSHKSCFVQFVVW